MFCIYKSIIRRVCYVKTVYKQTAFSFYDSDHCCYHHCAGASAGRAQK